MLNCEWNIIDSNQIAFTELKELTSDRTSKATSQTSGLNITIGYFGDLCLFLFLLLELDLPLSLIHGIEQRYH